MHLTRAAHTRALALHRFVQKHMDGQYIAHSTYAKQTHVYLCVYELMVNRAGGEYTRVYGTRSQPHPSLYVR